MKPIQSFRLATTPDGSVGGPFTLIFAIVLLMFVIGAIVHFAF